MEPKPESTSRAGWIALGILGVAVLVSLAILLDLGPFDDAELSESEFLARADEICSQAHADFKSVQESTPSTATQAAELTDELLAISREEFEEIAALDAPASLDTPTERYLDAREHGIGLIRDGLTAAEDGDAFAYAKAQSELASGQKNRHSLARRVGFSECSKPLFGPDQLKRDSQPPVNTDPSAPPTVANPPTGTP